MAITVKIAGVDRTDYVSADSFSIIDELTSRVNSASFIFICNSKTVAPTAGESVLIEEGTTKLFSGRILTKEESFFPPNRLKYQVECIDNTRDLDKLLVIETYLNQTAGDIIKDIIDNYTTGFTYVNVSDGPTITKIAFDYVQVSQAITQIAEMTGYEWYVDYNKDLYFFLKTDYPAPFQLDDTQARYKDLVIDYDISQLRNRVYVKSEKYETLDFTELFIGDGAAVTWTCKYQASATPSPSATLDDVAKTVGWDGVDDPASFAFMLNASTKVLSLGTEGTPADGAELVITYGADQAIVVRWDDQDSIDAVIAIEGGDGIFEHCITDNNIDTKEWAIDVAKADLLQNADPIIKGTFTTNESSLKSGQIITLNSTKRDINKIFLIQKIELVRILPVVAYPSIPYRPAATATIGYKTAATAEKGYKSTSGDMIYYIYEVTIATKLKGLEDLILSLLYNSNESLKRDTTPPAVPTNLALSTGMGEYTQASLSWIKAEWDANTEDDFSHYELKYKKTAYSDYGLVSSTNTTFLWTGLEQNVEYEVYICSVDIYGNRSAWSSQVLQTTATDSDTPAQVSGATAIALLSGIKVTWTISTENNLAGYIVERQESDDGTTWTGAWTEIVRTDATMWLDLLLTYTKYYRYRVTAYTQTGTEGSSSTPTADSIAPDKAGTNDIIADAITASLIASDQILANHIKAGEIQTSHLAAGSITLTTIADDYDWDSLPEKPILPSDENLVGYWSLNEGTGTKAKDSSGNGNDGTLTNMEEADWVKGVSGQCLSFDGANEYITCPHTTSLNITDITISMWVKWGSIPTTGGYDGGELINKSAGGQSITDGYYLGIDWNTLRWTNADGSASSNVSYNASNFSLNTWYHLTVTCDTAGKMIIYVNGINVSENTLTKRNITTAEAVEIGAGAYNTAIDGKIDEVRIYNIALTAEQVKALYENPSGLTTGTNPGADITGDNTAADIINLPATPAGAGLYATGTYLGYYDSSSWKAYIQSNGNYYFGGNASNYIQWNGSSLVLKGTITLVNTIPNAKVDGLGSLALADSVAYGDITGTKPPSNADVTLSAIQGELSLAGGGLVLASAGAKIRGGQTAYATGTGFWLGDVSGVSKFSIGTSTRYLKWDGTKLDIQGNIRVGATGSEAEIYFKDSGVYCYDFVAGGGANTTGISFKNSTTKFFIFWNHPTNKNTYLRMYGDDTGMDSYTGIRTLGEAGYRHTEIAGYYSSNYVNLRLEPGGATQTFKMFGTGQFELPELSAAPTSNNANGQIASDNNADSTSFHIYSGGWRNITSNAGW